MPRIPWGGDSIRFAPKKKGPVTHRLCRAIGARNYAPIITPPPTESRERDDIMRERV